MDIRELSGIPDKELRGGVWGVTLRENGIFPAGVVMIPVVSSYAN